MQQDKQYSVLICQNSLLVQYTRPGESPQTLTIFRKPVQLAVRHNTLLGIYADFPEPVSLFDNPVHNAEAILNAVTNAMRKPAAVRGWTVKALACILVATTVSYGIWALHHAPNLFPRRVITEPLTVQSPASQAVSQPVAPGVPPERTAEVQPKRLTLPASPAAALQAPVTLQTSTPSLSTAPVTTHPRQQMADVLKRNAGRGMFTITLSAGHKRTLYAFLDPTCSICRQVEPAIEQLTRDYNVVIFPVSVVNEGGDAVNQIVPLLCQKDPAKRAGGWQQLFRADAGMTMPGTTAVTEPVDTACAKAAEAAVGVNNLGFRQFGFGGTPWVLTDTGFHLPTGLLSQPDKIDLFLDTTDSMTPEQADQFLNTLKTEG